MILKKQPPPPRPKYTHDPHADLIYDTYIVPSAPTIEDFTQANPQRPPPPPPFKDPLPPSYYSHFMKHSDANI